MTIDAGLKLEGAPERSPIAGSFCASENFEAFIVFRYAFCELS
jgi:hypothetical protein